MREFQFLLIMLMVWSVPVFVIAIIVNATSRYGGRADRLSLRAMALSVVMFVLSLATLATTLLFQGR